MSAEHHETAQAKAGAGHSGANEPYDFDYIVIGSGFGEIGRAHV